MAQMSWIKLKIIAHFSCLFFVWIGVQRYAQGEATNLLKDIYCVCVSSVQKQKRDR